MGGGRPRIAKALEALALLALATGICEGQGAGRPCDPATPLGPSHDLYCIELVAAPGVSGVSGRVELAAPPSPFTVAVTADGHARFIPIFYITGLPSTGTYVAWATTPQMDSVIKLGTVKNGSVPLRAIDFDKFNILISSERSARVREPHGRIIVRGQSPSTRPFPPDLMEFSLSGMGAGTAEHVHDVEMPPVPRGLTMLPAEMALRPDVAPFLPATDAPLPNAGVNEVLRVKDGDIIDLDAELVRRTINGQTYTMYSYNGQYPDR